MLDCGFFNMDCMDGMRLFPDKYFQLAIVDPPYGIGADKFSNASGWKGGISTAKKVKKDKKSWDDKAPDPEYFAELFRVSANQIIWGGNYFDLPPTRGIIAWDKYMVWENFSQFELAWTSFNRPAAVFRFSNSGNRDGKKKIHPTQKPVQLYDWLLNKYANPGDIILDTHVGSASSLIACRKNGFKYVGFEKDRDYYIAAKKRLDEYTDQMNIFDFEI